MHPESELALTSQTSSYHVFWKLILDHSELFFLMLYRILYFVESQCVIEAG